MGPAGTALGVVLPDRGIGRTASRAVRRDPRHDAGVRRAARQPPASQLARALAEGGVAGGAATAGAPCRAVPKLATPALADVPRIADAGLRCDRPSPRGRSSEPRGRKPPAREAAHPLGS